MVLFIKKRLIIFILLTICFLIAGGGIYNYVHNKGDKKIILGGSLVELEDEIDTVETFSRELDVEKYFRPSKLPILNNKTNISNLITEVEMNEGKDMIIPIEYMSNAEDTIINYFSLLREAANPIKGKFTGCGTLGTSKTPYPIAYNFFTDEYKDKVSYKKYEDSFKNILHINLIKLKAVSEEDKDEMRYFYEIETIEGSKGGVGYFAYYYGYIKLEKDNGVYKISEISIVPEQYLCAPYHSWFYDGEASVLIKYGNWCNLTKRITKVEIEDYVKNIYFEGTDGYEYKIEFFILTNDYDIEVAQFRKDPSGIWERIYLNPEDCLNNK